MYSLKESLSSIAETEVVFMSIPLLGTIYSLVMSSSSVDKVNPVWNVLVRVMVKPGLPRGARLTVPGAGDIYLLHNLHYTVVTSIRNISWVASRDKWIHPSLLH